LFEVGVVGEQLASQLVHGLLVLIFKRVTDGKVVTELNPVVEVRVTEVHGDGVDFSSGRRHL